VRIMRQVVRSAIVSDGIDAMSLDHVFTNFPD
jgi:hypothetical protein